MPFEGNYASRHPMAPSVQSSIIDATSTLGGVAALSSIPGVVTFQASGDSVRPSSLLLAGNSVVTVTGALFGTNPETAPTVGILNNAIVLIEAQTSGIVQTIDRFYWRAGEQSIYETYRITGEAVRVSVTATGNQGVAAFSLTLHVISV